MASVPVFVLFTYDGPGDFEGQFEGVSLQREAVLRWAESVPKRIHRGVQQIPSLNWVEIDEGIWRADDPLDDEGRFFQIFEEGLIE